jgi:seryl-tRNA synthetase
MLDLELVRHEPDRVKALAAQRGLVVDVDELLRVDTEFRTSTQELDELSTRSRSSSTAWSRAARSRPRRVAGAELAPRSSRSARATS